MLGQREEAADVTQDVFVRAFERLYSLKEPQAFRAWLIRLTINMGHDRRRLAKAPSLSLDASFFSEENTTQDVLDPSVSHDERLLAQELSHHVQAALLALSEAHRTVVVLHHMEGMPVEEIGRLLQLPVGTVKSRLARARAELRQRMAAYLER